MANAQVTRAALQDALNRARAATSNRDAAWGDLAERAVDASERFSNGRWWLRPLAVAATRVELVEERFTEVCEQLLSHDTFDPQASKLLMTFHLGRGTEGEGRTTARAVVQNTAASDLDSDAEASLLSLAVRILNESGDTDIAREQISNASLRQPNSARLAQVGALVLADHGDWGELLKLAASFNADSVVLDALSRGSLLVGADSDCRTFLNSELESQNLAALVPLIRHEARTGCIEVAEGLIYEAGGVLSPEMLMEKGSLLVGTCRSSEAVAIADQIDTTLPEGAASLRLRAALVQLRLDDARRHFDELSDLASRPNTLWLQRFRVLTSAGQFEEAEALLDRHTSSEPTMTNRLNRARLLRSARRWERASGELRAVLDNARCSLANRSVALEMDSDLKVRGLQGPSELASIEEQISTQEPKGASLRVALARCQIAGDQFDAAYRTIDGLPSESRSIGASIVRSWKLSRGDQNIPAAQRELDQGVRLSYRGAVHAPDPDLTLISGDPTQVAATDLVLYACCRDNMIHLPDFLKHHRAIGVPLFVLIDNGSIDGTAEFLAQQSDVVLYRTTDDFVAAGSGTRWINHLIDGLSPRKWVLFVDCDELTVFDGESGEGVQEFCDRLDEEGFTAAGGYNLDMHADRLADGVDYVPGESMLAALPLFTDSYRFQSFPMSPYEEARGGVREDFLGSKFVQMTKTPFIRADIGIRFLRNSHETTPAVVAQRTVALLHFKFIGDTLARHTLERGWSSLAYFGSNLIGLQDVDGQSQLTGPQTVRYRGPRHLVERGLLKTVGSVVQPSRRQL